MIRIVIDILSLLKSNDLTYCRIEIRTQGNVYFLFIRLMATDKITLLHFVYLAITFIFEVQVL